jgi:hypothetical protein
LAMQQKMRHREYHTPKKTTRHTRRTRHQLTSPNSFHHITRVGYVRFLGSIWRLLWLTALYPIPDSCRYSNPEVGCLLCPICCRWVYACGRSKNRKIAMNGAEWFEAYTATSSNGLPFRFCSHQPEPRLARCLFSPGRVPRFPSSISRDATEQSLGMDSFVPQFRYERNISGLEAKRATFRTIQLP